jgi:hypothetical protein
MNAQHNRMHPPTSSTPGQRPSPYGSIQQHTTPPNANNAQSQFSTPQNANQGSIQTNHLPQGGSGGTPQTPNFPSGAITGQGLATPLSPGSEVREKERVTVLLLINSELLMESMRLQNLQTAEKEKDAAATAEGPTDEAAQKARADKLKILAREYVESVTL